jgi:hypothetical protein
LDRDVRQLLQVGDLRTFERFVQLAAIRTGQILNVSDLARDAGVSTVTANRWLSVLEASYQIFLLQPFHANLSKRLVKAPKLYFGDTALATYLMGINNSETLLKGPSFGALFETAVVLEHLKRNSFTSSPSILNYFRTKDGTEADLLVQNGTNLTAKEIKTTRTLNPSLADNLIKVEKILGRPIKKELLAPVPKSIILSKNVVVKPWPLF